MAPAEGRWPTKARKFLFALVYTLWVQWVPAIKTTVLRLTGTPPWGAKPQVGYGGRFCVRACGSPALCRSELSPLKSWQCRGTDVVMHAEAPSIRGHGESRERHPSWLCSRGLAFYILLSEFKSPLRYLWTVCFCKLLVSRSSSWSSCRLSERKCQV